VAFLTKNGFYDAREHHYVEIADLRDDLAKVRPDCLLSLGEDMARILLDNGVRAKAARPRTTATST
jgi:hypothetical protein